MPISLTKIDNNGIYFVKDIAQILEETEQTVRKRLKEGQIKGAKKNGAGRWHVKGMSLRKYILSLARS